MSDTVESQAQPAVEADVSELPDDVIMSRILWLEGMEHALVRDPERQVVFDAVGAFVRLSLVISRSFRSS